MMRHLHIDHRLIVWQDIQHILDKKSSIDVINVQEFTDQVQALCNALSFEWIIQPDSITFIMMVSCCLLTTSNVPL